MPYVLQECCHSSSGQFRPTRFSLSIAGYQWGTLENTGSEDQFLEQTLFEDSGRKQEHRSDNRSEQV